MDVLIAHITEFYFNDLRDNLYRAKYIVIKFKSMVVS